MPEPRPDFLIIGGAKCATTWLQRALQQSPEIVMPDPELHYFSREFRRGPDWYAAQFPPRAPGQLMGEKSNTYLTAPEAAARIHAACPQVRLAVQLRDPVARAYSDYCMLLRRGEADRDIIRWLDPQRAAGERFLQDGLYGRHLSRFLALFPRRRILLLLYEETVRHPQAQLARLAAHIGCRSALPAPPAGRVKDRSAPMVPLRLRQLLHPARPWLDRIRHRTPLRQIRAAVARPVDYPPLPAALAAEIRAFYRSDTALLQQLMGCDLSAWDRAPDAQEAHRA
ncbi:sulfotransferase domain-containing protein (plasmid) [Leisingera sp. S132]|uniref:sulfotransferase family protein n=1 Tax=Leisingera sp. S132 TaxID=2867016 RepID=UPI0021A2696A|nr:sulfotransferase [Leisingera sp. S132]UWQ81888.1 sulfotransferase domain-containing protein [Leisingera sp. S132]